jgi:hypothetical protein
LKPCLQARDTCMCRRCANAQLLLDAAYSYGLVGLRDLEVNMRRIVCDEKKLTCMKRECADCQYKLIHDPSRLSVQPITFYQWEKTENERGFQIM